MYRVVLSKIRIDRVGVLDVDEEVVQVKNCFCCHALSFRVMMRLTLDDYYTLNVSERAWGYFEGWPLCTPTPLSLQ